MVLLVWLACAGITAWLAKEKGRTVAEGVILGILLGFIGIIIELCLPRRTRSLTHAAGPVTLAQPGRCKHWHAKQVRNANDDLVAWLCTDCDTQLPRDWAIPQ